MIEEPAAPDTREQSSYGHERHRDNIRGARDRRQPFAVALAVVVTTRGGILGELVVGELLEPRLHVALREGGALELLHAHHVLPSHLHPDDDVRAVLVDEPAAAEDTLVRRDGAHREESEGNRS